MSEPLIEIQPVDVARYESPGSEPCLTEADHQWSIWRETWQPWVLERLCVKCFSFEVGMNT